MTTTTTADAAIIELFGNWQRAMIAGENCDDQAAADAAAEQIFEAPASGAAGLAIKAFMFAFYSVDGVPGPGNSTKIGRFGEGDYGTLRPADDWLAAPQLCIGPHAMLGLLRDAVRFAPELEPLVADVLASPRFLTDGESHDAASIAPDPFALGGRSDDDDARSAQLRRACEEIAAEYRAPLPEGDAGLIAAVQRWSAIGPRHAFALRCTFAEEEAIVAPIGHAAQIAFEDMIKDWPVEGLAGAAAKMRYLIDDYGDVDESDAEPILAVIERSLARGLPAGDQAAEPVARGLSVSDPIIELIAKEEKMSELAAAAHDKAFVARLAATKAGQPEPDREDDPLFAEAKRLEDTAGELLDQVRAAKATTFAGAIAQIKVLFELTDEDGVKSVVASLRNIERLLAGGAK